MEENDEEIIKLLRPDIEYLSNYPFDKNFEFRLEIVFKDNLSQKIINFLNIKMKNLIMKNI